MSKKRTWWALYWPNKKKLVLWDYGLRHELHLFKTREEAKMACSKNWDPPPDGPVSHRVTINIYGEKR